jgi:uncharacterized protein DUF3352
MPSQPRRTNHRARASLLAALLLALALLFSACGEDDKGSGSAGADPATVAPADAAAYVEVLLHPDGDAADGVVTAIRRVSLLDDPIGLLRRELEGDEADELSFTRDVEPWLGDRGGAFMLPTANDPELENPDMAATFEVTDRDAAQDAIDKLDTDDKRATETYDGVDYSVDTHAGVNSVVGLVGDFFVVGTTGGFRAAVDASRGDSLGDSQRYEDTIDRVEDDALAFAYVDPEPLLPALAASADTTDPTVTRLLEQARAAGPVALSLTASADQIALEISGDDELLGEAGGSAGDVSIDDVPGDAWAALAMPPLGTIVRQSLEQSGEHDQIAAQLSQLGGLDLDADVLDWLGGVAAFVRGTAPLQLGGGVVIGSSDPAASRQFVTRLERIVSAIGLPVRPAGGSDSGFEVTVPDSPQPIVVLTQDDKVAIGFGSPSAHDALDPDDSFADSEDGKAVLDTLGEGYEPSFALLPGPLLVLLRAVGADQDPDFQQALPYLRAYRSIAAGTKHEDGDVTVRIVAALQDPGE